LDLENEKVRFMRLTVRKEQMDVMQAVADANFERRIAAHLRESYPTSIVRLPHDGGEFAVSDLGQDSLDRLVRAGVAKARHYEMHLQSSIAAFVTLMFDVAPNFDDHRLCEVLLGDEEKIPDERIDDVLTVLTDKNWDSIRNDYDAQAWLVAEQEPAKSSEETAMAATADSPSPVVPDKTLPGKTLSGKTLKGKTLTGKTLSRTMARRSQTIKVQPEVPERNTDFDQKTMKVDRND
jgi:hypothetical protein